MGELKAPIGANTAHLCIDMQRLFSDEGPWPMAWMPRVTPKVEQLFARAPERTIFTRFIPPERSENAPGRWRVYYEKWSHVDGQNFKLALGRSFWPLLVEERHEIEKLFRNDELRRLLTQGEDRDDHADVRM